MRLATLRTDDGERVALGLTDNTLVCLDRWIDGPVTDPLVVLDLPDRDALESQIREEVADPAIQRRLRAEGNLWHVDEVDFAPPVWPGKIVCLALNYVSHADEGGFTVPDRPVVFLKGPNTVCGHGDEIVVPQRSRRVDHEGELAVVVGRRTRDLGREDWREAVAGYTIMNDLTARDLQLDDIAHGHPWDLSKSFDGFGPVGPWLVTTDQIADPQALDVTVTVNGRTRQRATTAAMAFSVAKVLSYLSEVMTLEPGDLIATGTPDGIGPVPDGATVTVSITGLGSLSNRVRYVASGPGAS